MFHIFSKKQYLIDFLGGFVDIHNHILPGIDDGAETVADSTALLKGFSEFGVKKFIATPHIMHHYYPNDRKTIQGAQKKLQAHLLEIGMSGVSIDIAAEHMIDGNFELLLEQEQVMPMKNRFFLIEMSYLQPPINFDEAVYKIADHRYFPILAHPERYNFIHHSSSKFRKFKNDGILLQTNLLSFGTYYGKEVQKKANILLNQGLIDYVASDIHNVQQLAVLKELQINKAQVKLLLPIIQKTISDFQ